MYYILLFFLKLVSYTPFWLLYAISDLLYYPLYYVVRYRRKVVRRNLTESFPKKSLDEIKQIEKKFYHHFVDMAFESCKLSTISIEEIRRRAVFKNVEAVDAIHAQGQSTAVMIGHYGNWEWITSLRSWLTADVHTVQIYHKLSNDAMERLMLELRERLGNKCVLRHDTVRYMVNAADMGQPLCVGYLSDQSPKRRESKYFLPFLNHNVPVLTGTEKLIKHFGHAPFYLTCKRIKRGYFEYEFVPLCSDAKSLPDFELTRLYFERLEQEIKQQPELYLWTHNRFKYAK